LGNQIKLTDVSYEVGSDNRKSRIESRHSGNENRESRVDNRESTIENRQLYSRLSFSQLSFLSLNSSFFPLDSRFSTLDSRFSTLDSGFSTLDSRFATLVSRQLPQQKLPQQIQRLHCRHLNIPRPVEPEIEQLRNHPFIIANTHPNHADGLLRRTAIRAHNA
jgi:hypothetical protein